MGTKIIDLAKKLNISITTVSRALDGYSDVSIETRERVKKAAIEIGYVPNQAARQLRTKRTDTIGFILPAEAKRIDEPFFIDLLAGLGDGLSERNFDLLVANAKSADQEAAIYARWIQSKKVDGFILNRITKDDWRIKRLNEENIPYATLGKPEIDPQNPFVWVDGSVQYKEVVGKLLEKGFSKIGFIGGPQEVLNQRDRLAWLYNALQTHQLPINDHWFSNTDMTSAGGYLSAQNILNHKEPPDTLFCINDEVAFGVLHAAHEIGINIGKDLAVIGFDGVKDSLHTTPALSTLDIPLYEIGQNLVQLLLNQLAGKAIESNMVVQPKIRYRASTGD